jgi:hypothetical protein
MWTPAWDYVLEAPVPIHYFYEDGLPPVLAWNNEMEVCQPNGEWEVPHYYAVSGFNDIGEGPLSDYLVVYWVPEPEGWMVVLAGSLLICWMMIWRRKK